MISLTETYPFISEIGEKIPPKVLVGPYIVFVNLLTSKSNEFIFVLNRTEVVNFVKFPQAVYKILC